MPKPQSGGPGFEFGVCYPGEGANVSVALPASSLWGTHFWLPVSSSYGVTSVTG